MNVASWEARLLRARAEKAEALNAKLLAAVLVGDRLVSLLHNFYEKLPEGLRPEFHELCWAAHNELRPLIAEAEAMGVKDDKP